MVLYNLFKNKHLSRKPDSNRRSLVYDTTALPAELSRQDINLDKSHLAHN